MTHPPHMPPIQPTPPPQSSTPGLPRIPVPIPMQPEATWLDMIMRGGPGAIIVAIIITGIYMLNVLQVESAAARAEAKAEREFHARQVEKTVDALASGHAAMIESINSLTLELQRRRPRKRVDNSDD